MSNNKGDPEPGTRGPRSIAVTERVEEPGIDEDELDDTQDNEDKYD